MESYRGFSSLYDELIHEDIDYEKMASYILQHSSGRKSYLDLGCGTGNLSLLLGRLFRETHLVDLSPEMLTLAEDKFTEAKVPHQAFALSMAEIAFGQTYDLITSSLDALNYVLDIEEVEEIFRRVYDHLEEDGVFIFDLNSPYKLREILGFQDYVYTREDLVYTWENYLEEDIVEMTLNFFIPRGKLYERVEEFHEERIYEPHIIETLLRQTGFTQVRMTEDYTEDPLTETSERITFTVRKR